MSCFPLKPFNEPEGRERHSVRAAAWQWANGVQGTGAHGTDTPYRAGWFLATMRDFEIVEASHEPSQRRFGSLRTGDATPPQGVRSAILSRSEAALPSRFMGPMRFKKMAAFNEPKSGGGAQSSARNLRQRRGTRRHHQWFMVQVHVQSRKEPCHEH